jgi:hypothetical protein
MAQILYTLQFKGTAVPANNQGTILKARTTAKSCDIKTTVGSGGVAGSITPTPGGEAQFESKVTITGDTAFQETGTIAFGDGNRIHFSTVGEGYLGASPESALKHGSVIWKVDRGEGRLEGATGLITSNFFVSDTGDVTDNHFGILFVK